MIRRLEIDRSATAFHGGGEARHKAELLPRLRARGIETSRAVLVPPARLERVDLLHVWQLQDPREGLAMLRQGKERGVRLACTPLCAGTVQHPCERRWRELRREALQLADVVLCLSERERVRLLAEYELAPERVCTTPVGCTPPVAAPPLGRAPYVLLPASRLEPLKNQWLALQALRALPHPVLVTGTFHDPDYARRCVEVAGTRAEFVGLADAPTYARLLAGARVVLHPSRLECASLAVLEAAASGAASLVVSDAGSEREYLGEDARYVEPDQPESIAAGVRAAWAGYERETARRARLAARARGFTWERAAEATAQALWQACNRC
jgi:glycosyltransferase involved in cell wall biosynthesis